MRAPKENATTDSIAIELSIDAQFRASSAKHCMQDLLPDHRNSKGRMHGKRSKLCFRLLDADDSMFNGGKRDH